MKTILTFISPFILSLVCINLATAQSKKPANGPTEEPASVSSIAFTHEIYETHIPVFIPSNLPNNSYDEKIEISVDGIVSESAAGGPSTSNCAANYKCIGYLNPKNLTTSVSVSMKVTVCSSQTAKLEAPLQDLFSKDGGLYLDQTLGCTLGLTTQRYFLLATLRKNCDITMPDGRTHKGEVIIIYYKRQIR